LLYQSGYITIKNYDPETELYTLAKISKNPETAKRFRDLLC
jgi:hypothetical protein